MDTTAITSTGRNAKITDASDRSRIGQHVIIYTHDNQQATVCDTNGHTIIGWSDDVRFVDTVTTGRRVPPWAVVLGIIGLFFFLIGIVFFFVREDYPITVQGMTVVDPGGGAWVTCA